MKQKEKQPKKNTKNHHKRNTLKETTKKKQGEKTKSDTPRKKHKTTKNNIGVSRYPKNEKKKEFKTKQNRKVQHERKQINTYINKYWFMYFIFWGWFWVSLSFRVCKQDCCFLFQWRRRRRRSRRLRGGFSSEQSFCGDLHSVSNSSSSPLFDEWADFFLSVFLGGDLFDCRIACGFWSKKVDSTWFFLSLFRFVNANSSALWTFDGFVVFVYLRNSSCSFDYLM